MCFSNESIHVEWLKSYDTKEEMDSFVGICTKPSEKLMKTTNFCVSVFFLFRILNLKIKIWLFLIRMTVFVFSLFKCKFIKQKRALEMLWRNYCCVCFIRLLINLIDLFATSDRKSKQCTPKHSTNRNLYCYWTTKIKKTGIQKKSQRSFVLCAILLKGNARTIHCFCS